MTTNMYERLKFLDVQIEGMTSLSGERITVRRC